MPADTLVCAATSWQTVTIHLLSPIVAAIAGAVGVYAAHMARCARDAATGAEAHGLEVVRRLNGGHA